MATSANSLPTWTKAAGGSRPWNAWLKRRVAACCSRARIWARKNGRSSSGLPERAEWRKAILHAMHSSEGIAKYSKLPLSLGDRKPTDWNYPSVDHVSGPGRAKIELEIRLINDMKTIMSEVEFRAVVGHLAAVGKITPKELDAGWSCSRNFAIEQPASAEPPLPGKVEQPERMGKVKERHSNAIKAPLGRIRRGVKIPVLGSPECPCGCGSD